MFRSAKDVSEVTIPTRTVMHSLAIEPRAGFHGDRAGCSRVRLGPIACARSPRSGEAPRRMAGQVPAGKDLRPRTSVPARRHSGSVGA